LVLDPNSVGTRNTNLLLPDITESTAESRLSKNLDTSPRKSDHRTTFTSTYSQIYIRNQKREAEQKLSQALICEEVKKCAR